MADPCVVGLDVGGSHSRAVLATVDGRTLGTGHAGGGNPTVLGARAAVANIVAALTAALGPIPAERVQACVVGLAGVSTLMADPHAAQVLNQAWTDAGLRCPVQLVSDVTVSFAAGTAAPDGALLVSGTGAVAARMQDRLPARFSDGYGWLLGDEGSGFWIGRQAARAAIAAADGRRPMAELAKAVLAHLLDQEPESHPAADEPTTGLLSRTTPGAQHGSNSPAPTTIPPTMRPTGQAKPAGSAATAADATTLSTTATTAATARATNTTAPNTAAAAATAITSAADGSAPTTASAPAPAPAADADADADAADFITSAASAAAAAPTTAVPAAAAGSEPPTTPPPTAPHPSPSVRPAATAAPPAPASIGEGFALRGRRRAAELVRAVTAQPTVALAGLAPLVMSAYELGDPAAVRIVAEAAAALVESLAGVAPVAGEPVVLGGSVLVSRSPVFQAVAAAIGRRWPDSPIGLAADGAAGATWLAARQLLGAERAAAGHAVFTGVPDRFAEFS